MKIVVIDDESAMHLILRRMLGNIAEVQAVQYFTETDSAFSYIVSHQVDLVFVDISMPKECGLDFARRLRDRDRLTRLVFVTSHKEYALSAFDVQAFDYIVKPVTQERLNKTVERALAELHSKTAAAGDGNDVHKGVKQLIDPLTKREVDILLAIAEGLSNKEIAARFKLTEGTVKNHIFNLYSKLGINRRGQAIVRARELRILK